MDLIQAILILNKKWLFGFGKKREDGIVPIAVWGASVISR